MQYNLSKVMVHWGTKNQENLSQVRGKRALKAQGRRRLNGYMEDDLMEDDLKSFFRPFSNLKNWIMT